MCSLSVRLWKHCMSVTRKIRFAGTITYLVALFTTHYVWCAIELNATGNYICHLTQIKNITGLSIYSCLCFDDAAHAMLFYGCFECVVLTSTYRSNNPLFSFTASLLGITIYNNAALVFSLSSPLGLLKKQRCEKKVDKETRKERRQEDA